MTKPNLLRIHKVGAELFKAIQQKPTNEKWRDIVNLHNQKMLAGGYQLGKSSIRCMCFTGWRRWALWIYGLCNRFIVISALVAVEIGLFCFLESQKKKHLHYCWFTWCPCVIDVATKKKKKKKQKHLVC
jgi:hypothetical protein